MKNPTGEFHIRHIWNDNSELKDVSEETIWDDAQRNKRMGNRETRVKEMGNQYVLLET